MSGLERVVRYAVLETIGVSERNRDMKYGQDEVKRRKEEFKESSEVYLNGMDGALVGAEGDVEVRGSVRLEYDAAKVQKLMARSNGEFRRGQLSFTKAKWQAAHEVARLMSRGDLLFVGAPAV